MSRRPLGRVARRCGALALALSLGGALIAPAAFADPAPSTEQSAAPSSSAVAAPSSSAPSTGATSSSAPSSSAPSSGTPSSGTASSAPSAEQSSQSAPPKQPDALPTGAHVTLSAAVDTSHPVLVGDPISVTLTVTNTGTAAATEVGGWASGVSGSYVSYTSYDGFQATGPDDHGVTIEAGASRVYHLIGKVSYWNQGLPRVRYTVNAHNDVRPYQDHVAELTLPIVDPASAKGTASGIVFGDRNGNGTFDEGEGLAGVEVAVSGTIGDHSPKAITDASGRFTIPNLPVQQYSLYVNQLPDGWIQPSGSGSTTVEVDGSDRSANLRLRTVRPLSDQLHAKLELDKDTYQPGDTAHVRITLSNTGTVTISGIRGYFDGYGGAPQHLRGYMDWTQFADNGPGVTLNAGETRVFDVTGTVPQESTKYGYVSVDAVFEPGPGGPGPVGGPTVFVSAKVPGPHADKKLRIFYDRNDNYTLDPGEEIANVKVGLVDPGSGNVVAKAMADAEGRVVFKDLPPGLYEVRVFGPWAYADQWKYAVVGTCTYQCQGEEYMRFKPGPDVPETDVVPPAPVTQQPVQPVANVSDVAANTAKPADDTTTLANTGASVIGLSVGGLAVLAAGLGAVLFARRRRVTS
ncbi:LPXTG cell wall anchor domain-containing protein [Solihabitans fulvus]|uniref:LPXTG cell wall anchor domain-containing protein n=1 Tax=Solihabitans fulvus TaxID=1892852 RepID=A0A5B2XPU3_9PSEU|nr:SdrD B-like domain-containing protein [Solihabitans fulvus]KAA2264879.1 LPXTG cell wall anchor domain-containing protein [Solihabitans fulvus]